MHNTRYAEVVVMRDKFPYPIIVSYVIGTSWYRQFVFYKNVLFFSLVVTNVFKGEI